MRLSELGIHLFHCELANHDYLWFSSFEISKVSYSGELLHNYALSYALSGYGWVLTRSGAPDYANDLAEMTHYATPAAAKQVSRVRLTGNAINDRSLRTDDKPANVNSPDLGWRVVVEPWTHGLNVFHCYVMSAADAVPGVVRLGKKGCAMRVVSHRLEDAELLFAQEATSPSHPINPLDVGGNLVQYRMVSMPPHLLLTDTQIVNDWFATSGPHCVHIPTRFRQLTSQL